MKPSQADKGFGICMPQALLAVVGHDRETPNITPIERNVVWPWTIFGTSSDIIVEIEPKTIKLTGEMRN